MKIQLLLVIATLQLVSCETPTNYVPAQAWNTTDNGVVVFMRGKSSIENHLTWDGAIDPEKKAQGFGKLTYSNPDIAGDPLFGGGFYPNTTTYEGKMVAGKFVGEVIRRDSVDGSIRRWLYQDGVMTSAEFIDPGRRSSSSSSSGLSDGQLVGGMLGLSGIAGGDTGLAGAGLTMLSGNESAGLGQMASWATSTPGSSSGGSSLAGGSGASGGGSPAGRNLIDEWGLRDKAKGDDHMKYYIQTADQAFASYQKSGEKAYYAQHQEYAGLARDFHDRTGTGTQGYAR